MDIVALPPGVVVFLNALYHERVLESTWEGLQVELERAWLWLEVHGAYSVCPEEENLLENLGFLLREAEASLELGSCSAILSRLQPTLENAYHHMQHILYQRQRMAQAQDECLNDLLLAGWAVLQGRAAPEVLRERIPLALDRVACLRGLMEVYAEQLAPAFSQEVARGLDELEAALAELPGDEAALTRAARAAFYADVFQEWEQDFRRQSEQAFGRYAIPEVGADLEEICARGWQLDRSRWGLGIWRLRKVLFPSLVARWEEQRERVLLTAEPEKALLPVENAMEQLSEALTNLTDETRTAPQVLTGLEDALSSLSEAYQAFERARLSREHLSPTLATYYDAAQGVLGGSVADPQLAGLLCEEPLSGEFACARESLREYLTTRDCGLLSQALREIARIACEQARERELQTDQTGLDLDLQRWSLVRAR